MNKKLNTLILAAALTVMFTSISSCEIDADDIEHKPFVETAAGELVSGMRVGWNLGNTLDAVGDWVNSSTSVKNLETMWVKDVTSQKNIDTLKKAGFNAIRIPVSWSKCVDKNYNIRSGWMERVKEIANYAVRNDMYILLNTHHDEDIFKFMDKDMAKSLPAFRKIWEQIAVAFNDYDERLIFEALNEPRTKYSANEWSGGTSEEHRNLNRYYQAFVDTVRATGGNNSKRVLMINTYAASAEAAAMNGLAIPDDSAEDKIIVSFHSYSPYNFALRTGSGSKKEWSGSGSDVTDITNGIDRAYNAFVKNGIPVVIGEFGAMNRNNEETRAKWAEFYVKYARSKEMPCFWWDNGATSGSGELFGLLDRSNNTFVYPKIVDGLMKGTK
ncbi:MAG: glycoside hydrolase family 5 protein [Treponema sp.]|jgi:endoglucanase|nr:glycoside hydrolase family 5 protein [Treponema sp.]